MTDEKDIGRRSSQDRHLHRLSSISSHSKPNSLKPLTENPNGSSSFQRHPMDFVSVLSLSHQRRQSERDNGLSRSFASDLHPISYSYRSPSSSFTPIIALPTSIDEPTDHRQIILPTLTPRGSRTPRKFPSLTSISLSPLEPRNPPVPTLRTSLNVTGNTSALNKMPVMTTERKKKVQLPEHLRCPE